MGTCTKYLTNKDPKASRMVPATHRWHVNSWHPSCPHQIQVSCLCPFLIQRVLSLLPFGVKQKQQFPALCGERLLGRLGGIPWQERKERAEKCSAAVRSRAEAQQAKGTCSAVFVLVPHPGSTTGSRGALCSKGDLERRSQHTLRQPLQNLCAESPAAQAVPADPGAHPPELRRC